MYFPILDNLRDEQIYQHDIDLFDRWLGSQPKNTWKYLNPLQFAIDCRINNELATNIFILCTINDDIDLFEMRSLIRCPNCNTVVAKAVNTALPELNEKYCPECNIELDYNILKDEVEIYFCLKKAPSFPFRGNLIIENEIADTFNVQALKANISDDNVLNTLFGLF